MKPVALLAAALLFLSFSPAGAESAAPAQTEAATPVPTSALFHYEHDPRENPIAMRDIVVNPQAIYGFSPSTAEGSTLKDFANIIDWTNAEQVADARKQREVYHESMEELYSLTMAMMKEDKDIEAIRQRAQGRTILTTEKDATRLHGLNNMKVIPIQVTFLNDQGTEFDRIIQDFVQSKQQQLCQQKYPH
jgi:hypothetical protein